MSAVNEFMNAILRFVNEYGRYVVTFAAVWCTVIFVYAVWVRVKIGALEEKIKGLELRLDLHREVYDQISRAVDKIDDKLVATSFKVKNLYHDREDFSTRLRQIEVSLYDLKEDDGK